MVGIQAHKSSITTHKLDPEEKIANLVGQIEALEKLVSKQTVRIQSLEASVKSRDELLDRYNKMIDEHCEADKGK